MTNVLGTLSSDWFIYLKEWRAVAAAAGGGWWQKGGGRGRKGGQLQGLALGQLWGLTAVPEALLPHFIIGAWEGAEPGKDREERPIKSGRHIAQRYSCLTVPKKTEIQNTKKVKAKHNKHHTHQHNLATALLQNFTVAAPHNSLRGSTQPCRKALENLLTGGKCLASMSIPSCQSQIPLHIFMPLPHPFP